MPISNNEILLQVANLSTGYGKRQVLFDVSFNVKRGEIVLLAGGNGSGKSTVLRAIYGLLGDFKNRHGAIVFAGDDITELSPYQIFAKGLVYVPQKDSCFEDLTLIENLKVVAQHLPKQEMGRRVERVFEIVPELRLLKGRMAFDLSGGERQLVALGMALMQKPEMILLDEPSAGLVPKSLRRIFNIYKELNCQGITFLIVEHTVEEASKIANHTLQINLGIIQSLNQDL